MLIEVPRSDADTPLRVVGNPVKMSRVAEGPVRRFPRLAQHTTDVLRQKLGLDERSLQRLRDAGVI